jgi:hypothetical protein
MRTTFLILVFAISILLNSCGSKSLWTEQDKEKLKNVAMAMANSDPTFSTNASEQKTKFCDCILEKTMETYPNPVDQEKMSSEVFTKMNDNCREEAKK